MSLNATEAFRAELSLSILLVEIFRFFWWVVESDGHEALPSTLLEAPTHRLLPRVVGDDGHKIIGGSDLFTEAVERKASSVIGERVQQGDDITARLNDLIEVANRALSNCACQRTITPNSGTALEKESASQVSSLPRRVPLAAQERRAAPAAGE